MIPKEAHDSAPTKREANQEVAKIEVGKDEVCDAVTRGRDDTPSGVGDGLRGNRRSAFYVQQAGRRAA